MWWPENLSLELSEKDYKWGDDTIGDIGLGASDSGDCKVKSCPKWSTIFETIHDYHSK